MEEINHHGHEEIDTIEKAIEAVLSLQVDGRPTERGARRAPQQRSHSPDEHWRRELFLAGRDGSRRRQRWLNDRLADCEQAVEPSVEDWALELPRHEYVPYELADRASCIPSHAHKAVRQHGLPRHIRTDLKRKHVPSQLVKMMEDQIRTFASMYDEEDDFVIVHEKERPIHLSAQDPRAARFGRWLVHSLANLYGLTSMSQPPNTVVIARGGEGIRLPAQPLWLQL